MHTLKSQLDMMQNTKGVGNGMEINQLDDCKISTNI